MTIRLGDKCQFINGRAYSQEELLNAGKYKVLRVGNFFSNSNWYYSNMELDDDKYCSNGDLLFAWSASFGPRIWEGEKTIFHYHIWRLKPDESSLNKKYLYYLLQYKTKSLIKDTHGSIMLHLTKQNMEDTKVYVHKNINHQKFIADVLSSIDDKISLNSKICLELESMARVLYDYWFVQFDFPDGNGRPYKSSGGKMVFSPTIGREIPNGWGVKKLNEVCEIGSGYPFKPKSYVKNGKYKVITIKNVQESRLDLSTTDSIDFIPNNIKGFCVLKKGDALISLTGNVGRMCLVDTENLLLNQRVGKLLIKDVSYFEYLYIFLTSSEQRNRLEQIASGSSQSNLSPILATDTYFINPPKQVIEQFHSILKTIYQQVIKNKQEAIFLSELRDFLLPMLMNGQVSVN